MAQFDPTKMASFRGDEDSASPTTIIFKQMQAAGIPLNAGNIKQFMERIRSSPDAPGQIDKAAGGNFDYETADQGQRPAALRVERNDPGDNTPQPTDTARAPRGAVTTPGSGDTRSGDQREAADAPKNTSAQPTPASPPIDMSGIGRAILGGAGLASLPVAGAVGSGALARRMPGPEPMPELGAGAGPPPPIVPNGPAALPAPEAPLQLGGPPQQLAIEDASRRIPLPDQSATPLETPMQKAVAPHGPVQPEMPNITVRPNPTDVPMMPPLRPVPPRVPTPRGMPTMIPRINPPRFFIP